MASLWKLVVFQLSDPTFEFIFLDCGILLNISFFLFSRPKYALAAIKKKLAVDNPHVAMFALQVTLLIALVILFDCHFYLASCKCVRVLSTTVASPKIWGDRANLITLTLMLNKYIFRPQNVERQNNRLSWNKLSCTHTQ